MEKSAEKPQREKKPYKKPSLTTYGDVRELTRAGSAVRKDGVAVGSKT